MLSEDDQNEGIAFSNRLIQLLFLGIVLVFVGIVVLLVALVLLGGSGSVGGVIFIGPIPIAFGAGPDAGWLIAIGLAVSVISILLFLFMYKRRRKFES